MVDATLATDDQVHYALEDAEDTGPLRNDTWDTGQDWLPSLLIFDTYGICRNQMGVNDPTSKDMPLPEKIRIRREIVGKYLANLASWEAVEEAMAQMNLAWGQVRAPVALHEQPTLAARGAITEVDDRAGGTRPITQSPYRFSAARSGVRGPAPHREVSTILRFYKIGWVEVPPKCKRYTVLGCCNSMRILFSNDLLSPKAQAKKSPAFAGLFGWAFTLRQSVE